MTTASAGPTLASITLADQNETTIDIGSFDTDTRTYSGSVGSEIEWITVTPAATSPLNYSPKILPLDSQPGESGDQVDLSYGVNLITIMVVKPNSLTGGNNGTYEVRINRAGSASDDAVPTISIHGFSRANEGDSLPFLLTRTGGTSQALTVPVDVSETGGEMVSPSSEGRFNVTFPAGNASVRLDVATNVDHDWEEHSVVVASLVDGDGYAVSSDSRSASSEVKDNDVPGVTAAFTVDSSQIEEVGEVTVTVTVKTDEPKQPRAGVGTLIFTTELGTAQDEDFELPFGTGIGIGVSHGYTPNDDGSVDSAELFIAKETLQPVVSGGVVTEYRHQFSFPIRITDDNRPEADETFDILLEWRLPLPPGSRTLTMDQDINSHTITILEHEDTPESYDSGSYVTVEITDSGSAGSTYTITWNDAGECTSDYRAYLASDYWHTYFDSRTRGFRTDQWTRYQILGSTGNENTQIVETLDTFPLRDQRVLRVHCGDIGRLVSEVPLPSTTENSVERPVPGTYSSEPALTSLTVTPGTLGSAFNSYGFLYSVLDVPHTNDQITLNATAKTAYTISWHPAADADPNTDGHQVGLEVGYNSIFVSVDHDQGVNSFLYEVIVKRAGSSQQQLANTPATGQPLISGTARVGEMLEVDTSGISDGDGLTNAAFTYQWLADDAEIAVATGPTYTLVEAELGRAVKVRVSFTDDGGNNETLTSVATDAVSAALPPPDNVRAVTQKSGAVELTWQSPDGATVTGYRIERRRAGENRGGQQRSVGSPKAHHTLVEDTGSADTGYTDESAEKGVEYEYRVSARNEAGPGEASGWVRANSPATGLPAISGTAQVGETLTADTSGIADADGMENDEVSFQWTAYDNAAGRYLLMMIEWEGTYIIQPRDVGMAIRVIAIFTDDRGNTESLKSAPTEPVAAAANPTVPEAPAHRRVDPPLGVAPQGSGELEVSWTWPGYPYGAGGSVITGGKVQWKEAADSWDTDADVSEALIPGDCTLCGYTIAGLTNGVAYTARVFATNAIGDSPPSDELTSTPTDGTTFTLSGITRTDYPEDESWFVVPPYTVTGARATITWSLSGDDSDAFSISTGGSLHFTRWGSYENPTDADRDNQYQVTVQASDGTNMAALQVVVVVISRGRPIINGDAQVGQPLIVDTLGITDANGLHNPNFTYQWIANDGTTNSDIAGATNSTYQVVAANAGKTIRVRVSFTDDAGNEESLTSASTTAVAAAPPPPPDNVRAVTQNSGAVELTWEAPQDATVTGYRIERSRADENRGGQQRSNGRPRDNDTLVEDTGSADIGYTDKSAEKGVEYEYRVSARNEAGAGESSDWVRAGPESVSNSPATGAPTIRGTTQVGETLTADISGIADADGLDNVSFSYQWLSSRDTAISGATGETYTLVSTDLGKIIKVKATFTDDAGNPETRTSAPTGAVLEEPVLGDGLPGAPRNLTATPGNKEVTLSWDPPADNGNAPATRYRIEWRVDGKDFDKNHWGTSRETTYTTNDQANLANGVKYFFRVKAGNGSGNSYGPYGPASGEVSATPTSGSAVDLGTPVLSDTENLHHGMVQLDWEDIEDAGWYVVQYYQVEDGEWLDLPAEGVDIAFHGSSAVLSNLHGLSWLRVGAASCDGASEWSQIEELYGTKKSDWEGVPVPEVAEGDEIEPCPVVLGTPVLSEPEYLHHGMVQLDWQDMEDAGWYVVQYYHLEGGEWLDLPAEGVDIAFHGSSAVVSNLHGLSWLRVRAMSCDGASEWSQIEELYGTNASDWKGVPVPAVAEGDEIEPCSEEADTSENSLPTGAPAISGTAQVGETLTANTSGIADADGLSNVQYEYQWLADDSDIAGATNATYTLAGSEESKAITVRVSFTDDEGHEETLTSEATDAVSAAPAANSPATGVPTISGTAQVGETLMANTTGVADADGLSNVHYEYRWLADDSDISGAINATYTLTDTDEGKAIKVEVGFTDDAGNEETLTSAATDAVAAAPTPNSPVTKAYITVVIASGDDTVSWSDPGGCSSDYNIYKAITPSGNDSETSHIHLVSAAPGSTQATLDISHSEDDRYPAVEVELYCGTYDAASSQNLLISSTQLSIGGTSLVGINIREGTYSSAPLTALTISSGMLSPDFDRGPGRYSAEVPSDVEVITLDPTVLTGYQTDFVKNPSLYTVTFCRRPARLNCFYSYGDGTTTGIVLSDADTDTEGFQINLDPGENRLGIGVHKGPVAAGPAKTYRLTITRAANTPATGQPTINGTAQVGEVLEVDTSGIADADGLANVTFSYQWLSSRDTEIGGATSPTYTLQPSDEGKTISVQVSFNDDADNKESLTSAATDAVAAADAANSPATGAPTISGTAQVGETLTANTSGVADADGLGNVQYEYQWLASRDTEIQGATGSSYTVQAADEGKTISVQVSFTDDAGNEETLTSAATDAVAAAPTPNSPATGAPTINGTVQVGETLTADTSDIADEDGLSDVQYEYQWLADDAEIAGAASLTYTPADTDEGKAIKVEVTFTDDAGNEETLTSAATDAVAAAPTSNSPATGAPTINGTVQVGETLTANTSGIADADGLSNVQYEYQWLADDAEVAGATSLTYTLADTDEGKIIKVEVSFTDDTGNGEALTSAATDAVAAAEPSEPPDKPRGLEATATHDSVTLTWKDPEDESITGYVILRRVRVNDQGGDFSELVANTGSAATTYTDNEVAASTTYTYRIKAINEHGTSERSRWVHIDTPAPPVPDQPTGLEATASNGQVVLTWDDPDDDSITGYVILQRLPGVDPEGQFDELVANTGTAATTYTDDTVSPETRYTYRIKAINEYGVSERSRWFHIDTPATP